MKIFEVIFSLCSGGGERVVVDLCNEFVAQGHDVTIITVRDISESESQSFNVKFLNPGVKRISLNARHPSPAAWFRIRRLLKQEKPEVVHMHLNVLPYFFPFALKKNSQTTYFHTLHSVAQATSGYPGQKPINRWFYRTGRIRPVTISDFCNRSFQEFYHLPPAACIYNGRTSPQPTAGIEEVKKEISRLKQHPDDKVFVQVATIIAHKNQVLAARVFARLHREGVHAILLMIGKTGSGEYLAEVKKELAPNTFILGEKNNVADYLFNADAFCLTSHYEGLPISILEAFACGCVPVCTAVGGIPDIIKERRTGYLAGEVSEDAFHAAVKDFLDEPEPISGAALQEYFEQNFTMRKCADRYLAVFEEQNHRKISVEPPKQSPMPGA